MKIAIQQPHYFPWVGYFDKMAKCDKFVLMDDVQMEKRSQMVRNRVLDPNGLEKYITIMSDQKGCYQKTYKEVFTTDNATWKQQNINILQEYYRKSQFSNEIMDLLYPFYNQDYNTVCEWTVSSIALIKKLLNIETSLLLQSTIDYDRNSRKSDLILAICCAMHTDAYMCGRGASVHYLDRDKFEENGVQIIFQDFSHPVYTQKNSKEFVPGISILDMLFNCGIERSRELFWKNVKSTNEFGEQK